MFFFVSVCVFVLYLLANYSVYFITVVNCRRVKYKSIKPINQFKDYKVAS